MLGERVFKHDERAERRPERLMYQRRLMESWVMPVGYQMSVWIPRTTLSLYS
jgi:hypothetical protein